MTELGLKTAFICLDSEVQIHLARVGHTCHLVKLANNEIDEHGNGNVYSKNYIAITNLKVYAVYYDILCNSCTAV